MTDERHGRIKELFLAACELPAAKRGAFLDLSCGDDPMLRQEVESLLRFYEESATPRIDLDNRPGSRPATIGDTQETVGPYRILRKLGEGGMGEVYEAEQLVPIRRRVAVKLIKWGMDTREVLARFESERQALALMNHPNIARVFEAGTTAHGRPYFAMEFVRGVPITEYCDLHKLTPASRLGLFTKVCQGVQHAHQKGVIHRDIKPSNILVAIDGCEPVPKIIDFGVAKATAQRLTEKTVCTALGQWIGTPEYMSPEQAEMTGLDIDTRTDVYSLGVVLYELLAGALPFDSRELQQAGFDEMRRRIREVEPPKPSTRVSGMGPASAVAAGKRGTDPVSLARLLRGDLDLIVLKALEKDRTRRYSSPAELAADIGRYLTDEPVQASPPSGWYRTRKFVRRHRVAVTAGSLVGLSLLVGLVLASVLLVREQRAERIASTQVELLSGLFESLNPLGIEGGALGARDFLAAGSDRIDRELADQPLVRARLKLTVAQTYLSLGLPRQARPLLDDSLETRQENLGADAPEVAEVLNVFGQLHAQTGEFKTGLALARRALEIREKKFGGNHAMTAESLHNLCFFLWRTGDYEAAESACQRALTIRESTFGPDHWGVADTLFMQSKIASSRGDLERARGLVERAIATFARTLGPAHAVVGFTTAFYGHALRNLGERDLARAQFERSVDILENAFGVDHYSLASPLLGLGDLAFWEDDFDLALQHYRRCLATAERTLGPQHPDVRSARLGVAWVLARTGALGDARKLYRDIVPGTLDTLDQLSADPSRDWYNFGCLAALVGERDEALQWLRRALDHGFDRDILLTDPDLDSLRGDPEFEAIVFELKRRPPER